MGTEDDAAWVITLQIISALVRVPQRNRTNRMCMCKEKEIYFKKLAHRIMEAGKSNIFRMGQQVGSPGKSQCCS